MGTNYYLHENNCPHCNRAGNVRHIGKSSAGWCFGLHVYPDEGINTIDDWKDRILTVANAVFNEYREQIDPRAMIEIITNRGRPEKGKSHYPYASREEMLEKNHASEGPGNLLRHNLGNMCVGHGEGTWDYIEGEFS